MNKDEVDTISLYNSLHLGMRYRTLKIASNRRPDAGRIWHALPDQVIHLHTYYATRYSSFVIVNID